MDPLLGGVNGGACIFDQARRPSSTIPGTQLLTIIGGVFRHGLSRRRRARPGARRSPSSARRDDRPQLYRTAAGGSQLKLLATIADNTTQTYSDASLDAALGANAPTVNTATAAQVVIGGIPIGPATVTARYIYRTAAGSSQLRFLNSLGDNTTTFHTDTFADAQLQGNVPTADTSGIQQPAGSDLAGASSILVAGAGWANPAGGWAIIGNGQQTIRYTGISGNSLTGIPATGPGAITATVSYNSTITGAAALLGVTGYSRPHQGADQFWVERNDPPRKPRSRPPTAPTGSSNT